ncbi:hypothetical protein chiPu_0001240 [Chiloscyllium punctatum]|uniref:Uncharacterized protein n=2 Tax=Chiloscyllium punctatum TaxID=137246 RepID=A0A401RXG7_CHIPU|nr:hypothetical protein [Chiloscyllium punctatum]
MGVNVSGSLKIADQDDKLVKKVYGTVSLLSNAWTVEQLLGCDWESAEEKTVVLQRRESRYQAGFSLIEGGSVMMEAVLEMVSHDRTTLLLGFFMASGPQNLQVGSGALHFPQLVLVTSIAILLLLIMLVIPCAFCRRVYWRIRKGANSFAGQQKVVFMKNHNVPVQAKDDSKGTKANRMTPSTDQQTEKVDSVNLRRIPSIPLTSIIQIEESSDDNLYEVVKDIQVNEWASKQENPEPQNLEYMTPCETVSSADSKQMDECSNKNKEAVEGLTSAPIYAKIIKQRNKANQSQVREKFEVQDEVEIEEPPPIPDKHFDEEGSAQC